MGRWDEARYWRLACWLCPGAPWTCPRRRPKRGGGVAPAARVARGRPLGLQAHRPRGRHVRGHAPGRLGDDGGLHRPDRRGSSPRSRAGGPSISTWWRRRRRTARSCATSPPRCSSRGRSSPVTRGPGVPVRRWTERRPVRQHLEGRRGGRADRHRHGPVLHASGGALGRTPAARDVLVQPRVRYWVRLRGLPAWVRGGAG